MKLFEHKPFDARAVMGFGILNGISIGLLNLSLGFNSVGFYQVCCLVCARLMIWYAFFFPTSMLWSWNLMTRLLFNLSKLFLVKYEMTVNRLGFPLQHLLTSSNIIFSESPLVVPFICHMLTIIMSTLILDASFSFPLKIILEQ